MSKKKCRQSAHYKLRTLKLERKKKSHSANEPIPTEVDQKAVQSCIGQHVLFTKKKVTRPTYILLWIDV